MKKHIWLPLSIWFSVLQCFCWNWKLPVSAATTETLRTADGIYYEILDNQAVQITGSKDTLSELVVPNEIDGLPVTKIKDYAFVNHTRLRSVSISESVQEIGSYAFVDCSRLETITVPDTLQDVGWGIFSHTPWLNAQTDPYVIIGNQILIAYKGTSEDVVIPDGVRIIAGFTFENDMTIQSVQLPNSLISLNAYAFAGCRNLQELQLPGQLQKIGANAFFECKQLQSMNVPDTVQQIGEQAFYQCNALRCIRLPEGITEISTRMFYHCTALQKISIPDSVRHIAPGAFQGCTSLTAVVLPERLISVGESAFAECSRLQQILFCSVACTLDSSETTFPEQAILVSEPNGSFRNYADTYQRSFVALPIAYGDVDDDGKIDVSDAVLILVAYAKSCADQPNSFSDRQKIAADYNQDGKIEVSDAVQVLTSYAKLAAGQQLP